MEAQEIQYFNTYKIEITGLVQGVGFRPFIYKLAHEHKASGWVENRNDGVVIVINGKIVDGKIMVGDVK